MSRKSTESILSKRLSNRVLCSKITLTNRRCKSILHMHEDVNCTESDVEVRSTWVATPTGHVFVWHFRIMMQPSVMSGAVAKPNSSAPSSAATAMSRPVRICPSACKEDASSVTSLSMSVPCQRSRCYSRFFS